MTPHLPTLLFAAVAAMALSASVMSLVGFSQRVYRGFWWWTAAQWLAALGLGLQIVRESHPEFLPLSNLLLLQWPVLTLQGVRRFYPRESLRAPAGLDWLLLAAAFLLWLAAWAGPVEPSARIAVFCFGSFLLYAYCLALLPLLTEFRRSAALKALALTCGLAATAHALRLGQTYFDPGQPLGPTDMLLGGMLVTLSSLVMVYLALLLTYERTERELRASQRRLRFLADMDMLTEVPNRRHFHELGAALLRRTSPAHAAVAMFDIDHFKQLNDAWGHAAGDQALRLAALCTRETLRAHDVAGRIGGDEFALLLPEASVDDALTVAARIVARIELRQTGPHALPLSLSFGVVQMRAGETLADALRRADQALYEAKRQGRSRAVAASGDEDHPVFHESRPIGLSPL